MPDMTATKVPMTKEEYLKRIDMLQEKERLIQNDKRRLIYHLQPPMGWLNDPNGLFQKDGVYHIYHQYVPFYPKHCSVMWGHVTTRDFINYQYHNPVIYPDTDWDANGPYSGSSLLKDNTLYFFYTGNVRHTDCEYDYITGGREQNTILVTSRDGFHFSDKVLLMKNENYPADLTKHVRDPYVFSENNRYFMLQGARDLKDHGSAILFESDDLKNWHYKLRFEKKPNFGYMWECPNYLKVNGKQFLIACPQGIAQDNIKYFNANQCGWFPLDYDFKGNDYNLGEFEKLDFGFDFYAPQVFKDEKDRYILLGWMSTPDSDYECESTIDCGWVHAMTVPRELFIDKSGNLCQKPLPELKKLRKKEEIIAFNNEFCIKTPVCFEMKLKIENTDKPFELTVRKSAVIKYQNEILSLDMTGCGLGRKIHSICVPSGVKDLHILSDTSSLEIFVNNGESVFTTRIFDSMKNLQIQFHSKCTKGKVEYYSF